VDAVEKLRVAEEATPSASELWRSVTGFPGLRQSLYDFFVYHTKPGNDEAATAALTQPPAIPDR
jgi:hypothetical protein